MKTIEIIPGAYEELRYKYNNTDNKEECYKILLSMFFVSSSEEDVDFLVGEIIDLQDNFKFDDFYYNLIVKLNNNNIKFQTLKFIVDSYFSLIESYDHNKDELAFLDYDKYGELRKIFNYLCSEFKSKMYSHGDYLIFFNLVELFEEEKFEYIDLLNDIRALYFNYYPSIGFSLSLIYGINFGLTNNAAAKDSLKYLLDNSVNIYESCLVYEKSSEYEFVEISSNALEKIKYFFNNPNRLPNNHRIHYNEDFNLDTINVLKGLFDKEILFIEDFSIYEGEFSFLMNYFEENIED